MLGTSATSCLHSQVNPQRLLHQPLLCDSPGLFCIATETTCDIAQELLNNTLVPLPPHPLKDLCLHVSCTFPNVLLTPINQSLQLLEVYVDDFLGLAQVQSHKQLLHSTCAVLHSIHQIFPPASVTKNLMMNPLPLKNFSKGMDTGKPPKKSLDGPSTVYHN